MSTASPEDDRDRTIRVPHSDGPPAPPPRGQPVPLPPPPPYGPPLPPVPPYGDNPHANWQPGGQPYVPPPHGGAQGGGMPHGVPQPGGFPPQGYGALPYTPVDKRQIRPRLLWIWLAWLVAVVAVIGGVAGFVSGVLSTVEAAAPSETFPPGETRSLTLDPADRPTLYVATPQLIAYECTISDGTLTNAAGSTTVTINGVVWRHILDVNVPRAGEYQLRCDIRGDATGVRFGVAKGLGTTVAGLGGSVLLLLIAFGGVLMAIIVTIVVVVRRSSARKRLSASYGR